MLINMNVSEAGLPNTLDVEFEYEVIYGEANKGVKYVAVVTIENKEIFTYFLVEPNFGELEDAELDEDDFKSLNDFLYRNGYVSYNDEDLVIDNYDNMHGIKQP